MKRTFLSRRNAFLSPGDISWGAIALAIAIVLLVLRLLAPGFFAQFTTPIFGVSSWVGSITEDFFAGFQRADALANSNDALLAQNAALLIENRSLLEKNADLTKLVGAEPKAPSSIVAGVIERPPESLYDTLLVGAGTLDGVVVDSFVYGPGGVPLGTVTSVTSHHARITLYSASGLSTNGWVGTARIPVTLIGTGGGTFSATAPRAANVSIGDTVFMGGPGAFPVGSVARVDGDPASPSLTLRIVPSANLFSLTWVRIVAP